MRGRGRPPKTAAQPAGEPMAEKPSQLKIGSAYDTHILTHPRLKLSNTPPAAPVKPGISITVQVPGLRRPKAQSPADTLLPIKAAYRRRFVRPAIAVGVILLGVAAIGLGLKMYHHSSGMQAAAATGPVRTQPDYQPLVPTDASTTTRDYNGQKDITSYNTTFSDARVTVSEQPLPANFHSDATALHRAADSINATHKIDTSGGPVYVADSTTDNSEMGIYASQNVLVFIHTDRKLDDVSWKNFIELMQAKSWEDVK